jgi:hypothetical protein
MKLGVSAAWTMLTNRQLGKPRLAQPCKRVGTALPFLGYTKAIAAVHLYASAVALASRELEAGGTNEAIEFKCFSISYDTLLGDSFDAFALCINKLDVGAVEGVEIFITEAGTLAELIGIWLQAFGGLWIFSNLVDTGTDLLHIVEVGQLPLHSESPRIRLISGFRPN